MSFLGGPIFRRMLDAMRKSLAPERGRRFNCYDQKSPSWERRAEEAAKLYAAYRLTAPSSAGGALRIADFGCGNERLRDVLRRTLSEAHDYAGYDLHPQQATTTRIDFNRSQPDGSFDAVFCLGLVEYLRRPEEFLECLASLTRVAAVSYVVTDSPETLTDHEREQRGWISHYTTAEFERALVRAGFVVVKRVFTNRDRTGIWLLAASSAAQATEAPEALCTT